MSVKITDLGPVTLPLVGTEQLELAISELESRRVAVSDLLAAVGGLDATFITLTANAQLPNERILTPGANMSLVDGGAGLPVTISLSAAVVGVSVNGVTLNDGGVATSYLDETGAYSVPPSGGITGIEILDEGLGLLTLATELNFAGAGVTASGAGVQKLITIPGFDPTAAVTIFGQWQFNPPIRLRYTTAVADVPGVGQLHASGDDIFFVDANGVSTSLLGGGGGGGAQISGVPANNQLAVWVSPTDIEGDAALTFDSAIPKFLVNGVINMVERAASVANVAGQGQFWVQSGVPRNFPMFTNNLGEEFQINNFDPAGSQIISGSWEFTNTSGVEFGPSCEIDLRNNADNSTMSIQNLGPVLQFGIGGADFGDGVFQVSQTSFARMEVPPVFIGEQAAAEASIAGDGQVWVANDVANTLRYTDDIGTEMRVNCTQWFNKSGDQQQVNNTTVFVNVTSLSGFRFDTGAIYHIEIFLKVNQANVLADIALRLNPQGGGSFTDGFFQITSISDNGTLTFQDTNFHTALGAVQNVVGNHVLHVVGTVEAGTADSWDLQFAQGTAQVANTIIDDASYLRITKIG